MLHSDYAINSVLCDKRGWNPFVKLKDSFLLQLKTIFVVQHFETRYTHAQCTGTISNYACIVVITSACSLNNYQTGYWLIECLIFIQCASTYWKELNIGFDFEAIFISVIIELNIFP